MTCSWSTSLVQRTSASHTFPVFILHYSVAVMLSPQGQSGFEAKILASASASNIWPRSGLDLVVLLCKRAFFGQKSCKIREFCYFSGKNLKSYVVNHYLVLFHNYFWPRLGLNLQKLASVSRFWPRLTSFLCSIVTATLNQGITGIKLLLRV